MACDELNAFKTATENLDQNIRRSTRLDRPMFWRNAIPVGTFDRNQGVEKTIMTIKNSEPEDVTDRFTNITIDGTTLQPTPACDTDYEDIPVGFYSRTYSPKKARFRGPVLCKEHFTFQHAITQFLDGYVDQLGGYLARVWEFALRQDYMYFSDIVVDYGITSGPDAIATAPCPTSEISQDLLDYTASELINVGAGVADQSAYVGMAEEGPLFTLIIGMEQSGRILKNNSDRRQDARWAFPNELWKRIGASRMIGNFRHVPTSVPPRANCVGDVITPVSPYRTIADMGTNGRQLTPEYEAAELEAAIVLVPDVFTAEAVLPQDWRFPNAQNYVGELDFVIGGEKICDPAVYDPQGEKGRHFAKIEYAPRPVNPFHGKVIWFKRCPSDQTFVYCT